MAERQTFTNKWGPYKWIVDSTAAVGTHTTIASALTSASAGDTIFIRPGTYTENLTLKNGVGLVGGVFSGNSGERTKITGKLIDNGGVVNCVLQNLTLETNSDNILALTGSGSQVDIINCRIDCANSTGLNISTGATASISFCTGDIGTTGIGLWTGAGTIQCRWSRFDNSGSSLTASTTSGSVGIQYSLLSSCLSTSGAGAVIITNSFIDCSLINTTALTTAGTGTSIVYDSQFLSGTASAISAGSGTTININGATVSSSNTNAMTGAGTIVSRAVKYIGSSNKSNVTTQTGGAMSGLTQGTAPSAGFLGERVQSTVAAGSAVTMNLNTNTNITSISLTAGIWDVECQGLFTAMGSPNARIDLSISTTSATLGTDGDNNMFTTSAGALGVVYPVYVVQYRLTLSATTTVYMVGKLTLAGASTTGYGRISATRVG